MASTVGATWGSGSQVLSISGDSTTELPEDEDQQVDECSSEWSDFGEHAIGPEQILDPADEQSTPPAPAEQQPSADDGELAGEEVEPVAPPTPASETTASQGPSRHGPVRLQGASAGAVRHGRSRGL